MLLEQKYIRNYQANGVVMIPSVVPLTEAEALLSRIDTFANSSQDAWTTDRQDGFSDRYLWPKHLWMRDFCGAHSLPQLAAELMESSSARLYFDHIFIRNGATKTATPWHQDRPYWPFQGSQIASIWVALSASDEVSGGLRFVSGSHNGSQMYTAKPFRNRDPDDWASQNRDGVSMPDIETNPEEFDIVSFAVQPGDVLAFNSKTIHGALSNGDPDRRRAALSIRYLGDDVTWDPRVGTDPIIQADDVTLQPGDPLDGEPMFPKLWP